MNPNTLVFTSLIVVIVLVAGIVLWHRRKQRHLGHASIKLDKRALRKEPKLEGDVSEQAKWEDDTVKVVNETTSEGEETATAGTNPEPEAEAELSAEAEGSERQTTNTSDQQSEHPDIIALRVLAQEGQKFAGYELLQNMLALDLRHGDMEIFHRQEESGDTTRILFSVASIAEPGTFNVHRMSSLRFPGVIFFMQISGQDDPQRAFELMLDSATQLAKQLEGRLYDERNRALKPAIIEEIQQRISPAE